MMLVRSESEEGGKGAPGSGEEGKGASKPAAPWVKSPRKLVALTAVVILVVVVVAYADVPNTPTHGAVSLVADVTIPRAASIQFEYKANGTSIIIVQFVDQSRQVLASLENGYNYTVTAFASDKTVICTSSLSIPYGASSFRADIACG